MMQGSANREQWTGFDAAEQEALPAFEVVSSGRSYKCNRDWCDHRVRVEGNACDECLNVDAEYARFQANSQAERELAIRKREAREIERTWRGRERRECWEQRLKTALEIWLGCWDWARKVDLLGWALAVFVVCAFSYIGFVYVTVFFGAE